MAPASARRPGVWALFVLAALLWGGGSAIPATVLATAGAETAPVESRADRHGEPEMQPLPTARVIATPAIARGGDLDQSLPSTTPPSGPVVPMPTLAGIADSDSAALPEVWRGFTAQGRAPPGWVSV
ncbi:hypothetical protein [Haloechinothrix salitolerans]|uniref:Uncharacterized protein n=1 Tax=Haloechinothrix salitolerans TaxID=926830 RepID=A0ABW2C5Z3_9PSEU